LKLSRDLWILLIITLLLVGALILMLLRLFEQSDEHVETVKNIKVTYSKSDLQPKSSELDKQIQLDLEGDPERKSAGYRNCELTNRSFKLIAKMTSLSELNLGDCTFDPRCLRYLKHLKLTSIDLSGTDMDDASVKYLVAMPLQKLVLSETKCSGKIIADLQPLTNLMELDLGGTNTNDEDLKLLSAMPIQRLVLSSTLVTDDGLRALSELKGLYRLDVSRMGISRKGIENLLAVKGLTEFLIKASRLHDEDIPTILRHTRLVRLSLDENPITDKGFLQLGQLKNLIGLSVQLCDRISDQAVAKFRKEHPQIGLSTTELGKFKLQEILE